MLRIRQLASFMSQIGHNINSKNIFCPGHWILYQMLVPEQFKEFVQYLLKKQAKAILMVSRL